MTPIIDGKSRRWFRFPSGSKVSQEDKATACKKIADKKNLAGADRRSFLKDCMNKAKSK
jgi:hypothetical protein